MERLKRDENGLNVALDDPQLEALTASSVATLMRVQDAEILASHHALGINEHNDDIIVGEKGDNLNGTVVKAQRQESFERASLSRDTSHVAFEGGTVEIEGGLPTPYSPYHPVSPHDYEYVEDSVEQQATLLDRSQHERRPTLSGQIFLTETEEDTNKKQSSQNSRSGNNSNQSEDVDQEDLLRRSESTRDRLLSEAAQFAAVVGDVSTEICIVEDDHDEFDDDDDDDGGGGGAVQVNDDNTSREIRSVGEVGFYSVNGKPALTETTRSPLATGTMVGRPHKPLKTKRGFLDQLPGGEGDQPTFIYKGIHSNPPEIVRSGMQRGNYAQLHRKAWLEVSDKYHRYGKNLRLYYRHWEKLGFPFNMFFDWLDSKGEAAGQPLPELEECPRAQLDSDVVLYITNPEISAQYAIAVVVNTETGKGLMVDVDGDPVISGTEGWIFVLRDNRMYGAQKITSVTGERSKQRFHHSSFFGGKAVEAAGIFITDEEGYLTQLLPHSGHYRPGEAHLQRVLFFFYHMGVDLRTFDMDMQQLLHVAREGQGGDGKVEKKKKIDLLCLQPAVLAACFLAHKARFIGNGIFHQIHKIKNSSVTTVTEALELID